MSAFASGQVRCFFGNFRGCVVRLDGEISNRIAFKVKEAFIWQN